MGTFSDKSQTTDSVAAGLDTAKSMMYPCQKCGKATKEHVGPEGTRICSNPVCEDRKAMRSVHVSELKSVEVEGDSPRFPCSTCGKETKEHINNSRICSSPVCPARKAMLEKAKS